MSEEPPTTFEHIRWLVEDLEHDSHLKGFREWDMVKDRYEENLQELKDLVELL